MRLIRRSFLFPVVGLLSLTIALWSAQGADKPDPQRVKRGRYLVTTHGCGDCHTPWKMGNNGPEQDSTRLLSGHPQDMAMPPAPAPQGPWVASVAATFTGWAGPWGVSFTKNLTPDKETGLGKWTEENFVQTIRTGREMGKGRLLLPPMPIPAVSQMTDEDLKSIYAYLTTIPAISNKVPDPIPPSAPPAGGK
jgi:mono/diheme cytochrome c family protein